MDFKNLLDPTQQKILLLLKHFYTHEKKAKLGELNYLNIDRTDLVKKYLQQIETTFPSLSFYKDGSTIYLVEKEACGYDYLCRQLIAGTFEVKVLMSFLLEPTKNHTPEKIAVDLFLSPAAINRCVTKLNQLLFLYDISFNSKSFSIEGQEYLIRGFYTEFLWEMRDESFVEILSQDQQDALEAFIYDFFKENQLLEKYVNHDKIRWATLTALLRQKNGHSMVSATKEHHFFTRPQIAQNKSYRLLQKAFKKDFSGRKLNIPDILWLCWEDYLLLNEEHYQLAKDHNPEINSLVTLTEDYLVKLHKAFHLTYSSQKNAHFCYRFVYNNFFLREHMSSFTISLKTCGTFLQKARDYYPEGLQRLETFINETIHLPSSFQEAYWQQQLLSLTLQEFPEVVTKELPLSIIVISDLNSWQAERIAGILQRKLEASIDIQVMNQVFRQDEQLQNFFTNFDLIITTFTPPKAYDQYPLFFVDPFITFQDLEKLHYRLQEIRLHKQQATISS